MIVKLEWLLRLQEDLPRPTRIGEFIRVISPHLPRYFPEEPPAELREIQTFMWESKYIDTGEGMSLRWIATGVTVAL